MDDNLIREIIAIGIGERKRSIIVSNRTIRKRTNEVLEGIKFMNEYISSLDDQVSLLRAIHKRFNISIPKARCYLCLIFLLVDNKEGESIRNRPFMDWTIVSVIVITFPQ